MKFESRQTAGQLLGQHLVDQGLQIDVVLGLPRGGVVVAAEVARVLQRPLSVVIVRKIGHPRHREYALGALAEQDVVVLDQGAMKESGVEEDDLKEIIAEEAARLADYRAKFHHPGEELLLDKSVMIVDDGLATGATAEAAILSANKQKARAVFLAVPVASPDGVRRLATVATKVVALSIEPDFLAVGEHYQHFPQTEDEEVLALLQNHA